MQFQQGMVMLGQQHQFQSSLGSQAMGDIQTFQQQPAPSDNTIMIGASGKVTFNSGSYGFIMLDDDPLNIGEKGLIVIPSVCPLRTIPPIGTRCVFDVVPDEKSNRPRVHNLMLGPGEVQPDVQTGYVVDIATFIDRWGLEEAAQNMLFSLEFETQQELMQKFAPKSGNTVATCKEELERPCDGLFIMFARGVQKGKKGGGKGKGKGDLDGGCGGGGGDPFSSMIAKGKSKGKDKGKMMAFMQFVMEAQGWFEGGAEGGDDAWGGGGGGCTGGGCSGGCGGCGGGDSWGAPTDSWGAGYQPY